MSNNLNLLKLARPSLQKAAVALVCAYTLGVSFAQSTNPPSNASVILEAAGRVEYSTSGATNWLPARVGLALQPGARVRTAAESRAAVQLSDRSVIRLNERTTLEILPPRREEKRRFSLPRGSLFFFNREKPADVEFDTPLAAGAIRGTEFLLEVSETNALHLALIDGAVSLQAPQGQINLARGEDLRLDPGQPPQRSALIDIPGAIQWALYYPAVVNPDELTLSDDEQTQLRPVLDQYRSGALISALSQWPAQLTNGSPGSRVFHAALLLAVGRVNESEKLLSSLSSDTSPATGALLELITTVKSGVSAKKSEPPLPPPTTSSGWLARSYSLQAHSDLPQALRAAKKSAELAPNFGFAHARVAELEFAFGNRHAALRELDRALALSPQFPPAYALRGYVLLEQGDTKSALAGFDQSRRLDAAYAEAWVGRGLCAMRDRQFLAAREAFQAAAALEPTRGLLRAYLGKASSELNEPKLAEKEFNLGERLDPYDPTAWFYSALHLWQENRINEAIRHLERSEDLNDQRAPFRSELLLDRDRSVRSANLAALYEDVGLPDVSRQAAGISVAEDYANFSGHLFLANSYQALEDVNRFNLRFETARESELLVANLLAPPGAGNLSQQLSQQEHLQFFDPRPLGFSSLTEYASRGEWHNGDAFFGTIDGFSYAFDVLYDSVNAVRGTNDTERQQYILTLKQRITPDDELYFQAGALRSDFGDVAQHYSISQVDPGFKGTEKQDPTLYAGWHHTWAPGIHTLFLGGRLDDSLSYTNPQPNVLFLIQRDGQTVAVQQPPFFGLKFDSDITLYTAELQQLFETANQSLILGARYQHGDVDTAATLSRTLTGVVTAQTNGTSLERKELYAYYSVRPFEPLWLYGGVSYDQLRFPENTDLPPISGEEQTKDLLAPKAGLMLTPWDRGVLRANYAQSLGGVFFDNSVRLEPSQIAGLNQAYRSLIPESVAGLVPGTEFETASAAFDQSFSQGTWFGVQADWLTSDGNRAVGVLTNSFFIPIPDSPGTTRQDLHFRERSLSAYAGQLIGDWFTVGARYRLTDGELTTSFPKIPNDAANLNLLEQNVEAILHQVTLSATFNHPSGFFAQWESDWYEQSNHGYTPDLAGDNFWQHNVWAGYRLRRRYAELRLGVLNLLDTDYHLNPLNLYPNLPRARTFVASFRLNF